MSYSRRLASAASLFLVTAALISTLLAQSGARSSLTGKLTVSGTPLPNSTISIYRLDAAGSAYTATLSTRTGAEGLYRFPSLAGGNYIVVAWHGDQRIYQGRVSIAPGAAVVKDIQVAKGR
jgi:Carboxypeptidase regulatory-like domain